MTPPRDRAALVEVMARAMCDIDPNTITAIYVFDQTKGRPEGTPPFLHEWQKYTGKSETILTALEASGAALVPVVATDAMLQAAGASPDGVSARGGIDWLGRMLPRYWAAMVAKTPYAQPPEARSDGE